MERVKINSKQRFFTALEGRETDHVPVFPLIMSFAANRYGVSYREFASNAHVLAEAQIKLKENFALDAITACSDAFRISADLGGEVIFPDEKPPYMILPLVKSEDDFKHLKKPDVANIHGRMADRVNAVEEMVRSCGKEYAILGWVDMPFAEACSVCGVSEFMMMLYDEPELAHRLLDFLTDIVIEFAVAQIGAGAPMVGAGDAAASLISPELYAQFALPYEKRVCEAVHKAGGLVKLHICGNTSRLMDAMVKSGADLFNVDHLVNLADAAKVYGGAKKCYKGNMDPVENLLYATPEDCMQKAAECIKTAKGTPFMLSPGCEVPAAVTDEVFKAFCSAPLYAKAIEK